MPPTPFNTSTTISESNNNESLPSYQKAIINFDEIKTLTTQNGGEKRPRIFSDDEFDRRLANLRDHMKNEVPIYMKNHSKNLRRKVSYGSNN